MKVTFCGHNNFFYDSDVKNELIRAVEGCIQLGADEFLLGGYGEFDILAAYVVQVFKNAYPNIRSVLVVPYPDRKYNKDLYDCSEYPPLEETPKKLAIIKRNEWMVDNSDVVISYVKYSFGGAVKTFEYAKRKRKLVINLADRFNRNIVNN